MKRVSEKAKGTIVFIAGVVVSVGSSYLYGFGKLYFELDIPPLSEKLIFLMLLLPLGFGMAFFFKAFEKKY